MLSKSPSVPQLISEKIRLKSRIQSRNYLLGEFKQIVKRENKRDSLKIAEIDKRIKPSKPRKYKSFMFF